MENSWLFLEQFTAHTSDVAFVYDLEKKHFEYLSKNAPELLELPLEEIQQQPEKLLSLVQEEDRELIRMQIAALADQHPHAEVECKVLLPNHEHKWLRIKVFASQEKAKSKQLAGIVENITRRKEYELGVLNMKEQKNIVLQVLGHDLRAPLNTISLSMMLMGQEINLEENSKVKELVEIVERTCRNSLDMIKEMLNLEYTETQQLGIKKNRIDVYNRIQNQIDTFRLLDKSSKTFLFHKPSETLYANTDSIRLMLILENLLTNAYKFTDAHGRIEVRAEERPNTLLISVSDNGIGIPDKLKPLIFDKFTRARRKGTQGEQPVGLGMHLIKSMVEQLEGSIWFESQEGVGTTFYVELPR